MANPNTSAEEWCRERLANLKVADRQLATLSEIRAHLSQQPESANWLTLRDIFNCIDTQAVSSGTEQTHLACDILSICMSNLSIQEAESQFYMMKCLQHSNGEVKLIALKEIDRNLESLTKNYSVPLDSDIVIPIIDCVRLSESVAVAAAATLFKVLPSLVANQNIRSKLLECLESSEVAKCRVFDLAIRVGKHSADDLDKVEFVLDQLYLALDTEDLLLQLNYFELLSDLSLVEHGIMYMENKGIIRKITLLLKKLDDQSDPMRRLILPGFIKFFGTLTAAKPQYTLKNFPQYLVLLFSIISEMDMELLPVALDTLGHLTRSNEGMILLHDTFPDPLRKTFSKIGAYITNWPSPLQIRALNCLTKVFESESIPPNNQIGSISSTWYKWLTGATHLNLILDYCRNPFPDIRLASVKLLSAICSHNWGIDALMETAGFVEHLLDRRADFDKEVKQEKYLVIQLLSKSSRFDATTLAELKRYVSEGAFYVVGEMEVAVEGF